MFPTIEKAASLLGYSSKEEAQSGEEARRHKRFTANETAHVTWKDPQGAELAMDATVVNVSVSGMAFLSSVRFAEGDWITIRAGELTHQAVVRHAREVESSYAIGVELYPVAPPLEQSLRRLAYAVANRRR